MKRFDRYVSLHIVGSEFGEGAVPQQFFECERHSPNRAVRK